MDGGLVSSSGTDGAVRAAQDETAFQLELWSLLAKQASLYTLGESSSISECDAHRLLASACYVLGVDPDDPDPASVQKVSAEGAGAVFKRNLQRIEADAVRVESLWKDVCLNMPLLESVALKDTLESLRDFKARYEPRFFAHEIPADIDYPLCQPVAEKLKGVDYVAVYLERLLVECRFLQSFDLSRCRALLRSVHPDYGGLILNLFEPIAANALGCALAGCEARSLRLDDDARVRLRDELRGVGPARLARRLQQAGELVCAQLGQDDAAVRAYLGALAQSLRPRIACALRRGGMEGVFVRW